MTETRRVAYSRLGADDRVSLPPAVRECLRLQPGDSLRFVIDGSNVSIGRAAPRADDECFSTFSEWASAEDDDAYSDL